MPMPTSGGDRDQRQDRRAEALERGLLRRPPDRGLATAGPLGAGGAGAPVAPRAGVRCSGASGWEWVTGGAPGRRSAAPSGTGGRRTARGPRCSAKGSAPGAGARDARQAGRLRSPGYGSLSQARTSGRVRPKNSSTARIATMTAAMGWAASSASGIAGSVSVDSPRARRAARLLALQDQRRREDRVGQQHHHHHAGQGDRRADRLVHHPAEREADEPEHEEGIAEEDADAAGHRAELAEHGPMMPPVRPAARPPAGAARRPAVLRRHLGASPLTLSTGPTNLR